MSRQLTATEARTRFYSLLEEVSHGEEIEITRHGRVVARILPARDPHALKGMFKGMVRSTATDEELFSTGEVWECS